MLKPSAVSFFTVHVHSFCVLVTFRHGPRPPPAWLSPSDTSIGAASRRSGCIRTPSVRPVSAGGIEWPTSARLHNLPPLVQHQWYLCVCEWEGERRGGVRLQSTDELPNLTYLGVTKCSFKSKADVLDHSAVCFRFFFRYGKRKRRPLCYCGSESRLWDGPQVFATMESGVRNQRDTILGSSPYFMSSTHFVLRLFYTLNGR